MLKGRKINTASFNPRVKLSNPSTVVMCRAALKASKRLLRDFGEVEKLQVSKKGTRDFVSNADIFAERIIREVLEEARPNFGFLMEESGSVPGKGLDKEYRWIIDPLDGTMNFIHGIPYFCISIGLEKAGEIISGVVYDPIRDELFCAEKGYGAYVNDQRLRVSGRVDASEALFGYSFSTRGDYTADVFKGFVENLEEPTAASRRFGASALDLCYLAAGRLDAYIASGLASWDVSAGTLMIREAGGIVTTIVGKSFDHLQNNLFAANNYLHQTLMRSLHKTR